jgi:hypothetical protein
MSDAEDKYPQTSALLIILVGSSTSGAETGAATTAPAKREAIAVATEVFIFAIHL